MKEKTRRSFQNLIPFLPPIIGIGLMIWIGNKFENRTNVAILLNLSVAIITFLSSHKAWLQTMELCGKKSFLVPLLIGLGFVIWIGGGITEFQITLRNLVLMMVVLFYSITSSKHWWKMARDENYKQKELKYWAITPWYKRPGDNSLAFDKVILAIPLNIVAIIYMLVQGLPLMAAIFCVSLILFILIAYVTK